MRLFVALEPPEKLTQQLRDALRYMQGLKHANINWVKPENLHLTVNFIGEVADHKLKELKSILAVEARRHSAAMLHTEGIELFPYRFPRLIWLKLSGEEQILKTINRQTLNSLNTLGIEADAKALKLHITLGRIKAQQTTDFERAVLAYHIPKEEMLWDTMNLYKSILRPDGPRYEIIEQYNLK